MLVDLAEVITTDGISLSGAYFKAKHPADLEADCLVYYHGDGGNFYSNLLRKLGSMLSENGLSFLAANRRGHDMVATGPKGGTFRGYSFESVHDSLIDTAAWLAFLKDKGHQKIALGGHSGGAVRATYAQANKHFDDVTAVVSVSPGEYNFDKIVEIHGETFLRPYRSSERNIASGNPDVFLRPTVPWDSMWTARTYVDCFNRDNRYSVSTHSRNTEVPTLYVFGGKESEIGGEEELPVCGLAMRTLRELGHSHTTVEVVEGANHGYIDREKVLMSVILKFLKAPT